MILITGGMYQGKRDFAAAEFGLTDADFRDAGGEAALDFNGRAIDHLEQFVLACTRAGVSAQEYLKEHEEELADQILIAADITQGVVPMDPVERAWREETGRCLVWLAQRSERVFRVFCGIPQQVK